MFREEQHIYQQTVVSVNYNNPTKHVGPVQSGYLHHHLMKMKLVITLMELKNRLHGVKQQSSTR
jgi:hypothetical protein